MGAKRQSSKQASTKQPTCHGRRSSRKPWLRACVDGGGGDGEAAEPFPTAILSCLHTTQCSALGASYHQGTSNMKRPPACEIRDARPAALSSSEPVRRESTFRTRGVLDAEQHTTERAPIINLLPPPLPGWCPGALDLDLGARRARAPQPDSRAVCTTIVVPAGSLGAPTPSRALELHPPPPACSWPAVGVGARQPWPCLRGSHCQSRRANDAAAGDKLVLADAAPQSRRPFQACRALIASERAGIHGWASSVQTVGTVPHRTAPHRTVPYRPVRHQRTVPEGKFGTLLPSEPQPVVVHHRRRRRRCRLRITGSGLPDEASPGAAFQSSDAAVRISQRCNVKHRTRHSQPARRALHASIVVRRSSRSAPGLHLPGLPSPALVRAANGPTGPTHRTRTHTHHSLALTHTLTHTHTHDTSENLPAPAAPAPCPEIQPHGLIQRHTTRPPPRQRRATPNLAQASPCRNPQPSRRRRRARGAVPLHPAPPARLFLHPPTGARYLRTVHRRLRYIGYLRRYVPASPALHLAPAGLCTARHITITLHPLRRPGPGRESDLHHHHHHHHQPVFRPLARRVHAAAYRVGPLSIPPSFPTTTTTTTTSSSTSAATTPTSTSLLLIHLSPKAIDSSLQRLPARSHSSASSSSHFVLPSSGARSSNNTTRSTRRPRRIPSLR
ncbi:hypothetical protein Purlil1_7142 [Purpureocillium lilacinum]|uniref:Uncharacterized protein n=1 Tax=Purpureocillium lilacinum TaxID=33203 RepID=A0ABR0BXS9_PURLI|nr:hypothetical protein Purlil1_7142 [Purpureocillium lilacinum]